MKGATVYEQKKLVVMTEPQTLATDATHTTNVDTIGYDRVCIDLVGSRIATATSDSPTKITFSTGDTTVVTDQTAIAELTGDGGSGFDIPEAVATDEAYAIKFNIDLLKVTGRYLGLSFTPGTTQTIGINANLGRGKEAPITAAKAGVLALVEY